MSAEGPAAAGGHDFLDVHPDDPRWGHARAPGAAGVEIHFVRQGQGAPVVLLHGWPGFWYDWRRVIPTLSRSADVLAPDLRGFGASGKPAGPPDRVYTPDAHAADMVSLIDHVRLDPAVLVGYDIGARVAQTLARLAPELIRALVLLNPPYPGIGDRRFEPSAQREFWYQHFHTLPWADQLIGHSRETVRVYLRHFYDHWAGRKEAVRPRELEHIVELYSRPGAVAASIAWYRGGSGTGLARMLHEATAPDVQGPTISQPTIVLWGDADPIFPVSWADQLPRYFSRVSLRLLPGVGHFVPLEAPGEVVEAVKAALSDTGQGPSPR
jgi:pimeloyl-ACP methyl ester carboxylesterase